MIKIEDITESDLEVIAKMNEVFLKGGRAGRNWASQQSQFAARYVIPLIEGRYLNHETKEVYQLDESCPKDIISHRALNSFIDFTYQGWSFLYGKDDNILDESITNIGQVLIGQSEKIYFRDLDATRAVIAALVGCGNERVLKTATRTFVNDPRGIKPFDSDIANKLIIPEAIEYAKHNSPFLREL